MQSLSVYLLLSLLTITSAASFDWSKFVKQFIPRKNLADQKESSTLTKLAILHRHGDRVSENTFKNDPYPCTDLKIWPDGEGQLTIRGKKRMLKVGRLIRDRYTDFLGDDPINVYARSSPVDRCLNSAQLVLAGAYPPVGRLVIEKSLHWQPIPIHTSSVEHEQMLITPSKMRCAASKAAKYLQFSANETKMFDEENREFFDFLSAKTGDNITGVVNVHPVYDSLNIAKEYGKTWPDWVTDDVFQRIKQIDAMNDCVNSSTNLVLRLDAGVFLGDLREKLEKEFVTDYVEKRIFFYSAHDSKLIPVMKALGIFDGANPGYGSALVFEQHVLENNVTVVRVFHLSDTDTEIFEKVTTRGCPHEGECDAITFFDSLSDFITDEETHAEECNILPENPDQVTGCFD